MKWLVVWVCLLPAVAFSDEPAQSSVESERRRLNEEKRARDSERMQAEWDRRDERNEWKRRGLFSAELVVFGAYVAASLQCARRGRHSALSWLAFCGGLAAGVSVAFLIALPYGALSPYGPLPIDEIALVVGLTIGAGAGFISLVPKNRVVGCLLFALSQLLVAWQICSRLELYP
jgi:hypothetical protein